MREDIVANGLASGGFEDQAFAIREATVFYICGTGGIDLNGEPVVPWNH